MNQSAFEKYLSVKIETASQADLIVMLYDGATKFLRLALGAMEKGNTEAANNNLIRAQDIIAELAGTLNPEAGEIAQNLMLLYDYMYRRLVEANINKSSGPVEEVIEIFGRLREAWSEVARQVKSLEAGVS